MEYNQPAEEIRIPYEHAVRIPYDDAPMEATLGPGEAVRLHGNIVLSNRTNTILKINEEFLLHKGGYHLMIVDQISGASLLAQSPMHSNYDVAMTGDQLSLKKI